MSTIGIYACDVGSTLQNRFAWARASADSETIVTSTNIEKLAWSLGTDLRAGCKVALGFEAPLFIPVPHDVTQLSRGRQGEGNRSWAAPAGSAVSTLAIHQSAWVLRSLREATDGFEVTLDCQTWQAASSSSTLLCWEAFVSGAAHSPDHSVDAATAAHAFREDLKNSRLCSAVGADHPISLIGAVALWCGLANDLSLLHQPALVIKPSTPYLGARETV